jgi:excisionase family DNA binding protein
MTRDDTSVEPLVGVGAAARHLDVTAPTLYRLIRERRVPIVKVGALIRLRISEVERALRVDAEAEPLTEGTDS